MPTSLRRVMITARISAGSQASPAPQQIQQIQQIQEVQEVLTARHVSHISGLFLRDEVLGVPVKGKASVR
jgi:hypothetical protein